MTMPLLPFGSVFLLAGLTARAAAGATIPEATTTTTTTTSEGEFGPSTPKAFRMLMSVQGEGNVAPMPLGAMATQQQGMWESWSQGSQQDIKPVCGRVGGENRDGRQRNWDRKDWPRMKSSSPIHQFKHLQTWPNPMNVKDYGCKMCTQQLKNVRTRRQATTFAAPPPDE